METDSYFTIESQSEGSYKDKGSRFYSFAFPVENEDEILKILENLRKEYHDARHHCYAWKLGTGLNHFRTNDDGEPTHSAGKPILGQIQSYQLTNVLIVVVRYFGGTLLGIGGLIQAYKSASMDVINNAKIIKQYVYEYYRVNFRYEDMNRVMRVLKDMNIEQSDQQFELDCQLTLKVRKSDKIKLLEAFRPENSVRLQVLKEGVESFE